MNKLIAKARIELGQDKEGRWNAEIFRTDRREGIALIGGVTGCSSKQEAEDLALIEAQKYFSRITKH